MASENGTAKAGIRDRLAKSPDTANFFQTIRRLESEAPGKARVGFSHHLHDDIVRFGQNIGLTFESAPIQSFEEDPAPSTVPFRNMSPVW